MRTDRRTDITKLIVAFSQFFFPEAPKHAGDSFARQSVRKEKKKRGQSSYKRVVLTERLVTKARQRYLPWICGLHSAIR